MSKFKKFFDSSIFEEVFPPNRTKMFFWRNKDMHSITQISHVGIIFDSDSEFKDRLPTFWLFTLSRDKVWMQLPETTRNTMQKAVCRYLFPVPRNLWQNFFRLKKLTFSQLISHVICIRGHPWSSLSILFPLKKIEIKNYHFQRKIVQSFSLKLNRIWLIWYE